MVIVCFRSCGTVSFLFLATKLHRLETEAHPTTPETEACFSSKVLQIQYIPGRAFCAPIWPCQCDFLGFWWILIFDLVSFAYRIISHILHLKCGCGFNSIFSLEARPASWWGSWLEACCWEYSCFRKVHLLSWVQIVQGCCEEHGHRFLRYTHGPMVSAILF